MAVSRFCFLHVESCMQFWLTHGRRPDAMALSVKKILTAAVVYFVLAQSKLSHY
jgi:hypothetical protein